MRSKCTSDKYPYLNLSNKPHFISNSFFYFYSYRTLKGGKLIKGKIYSTKYLLSSWTSRLFEQNKIRYKPASMIANASACHKLWFWHYYRLMKMKVILLSYMYTLLLDFFQNKLESEIFSHDLNLDNSVGFLMFFSLFIIHVIDSELFNFWKIFIFKK